MGIFQFVELSSEIGERPKRGEWGIRVVGRAPLRWPDRVVALGRLPPSQSGDVRWASLRRFHQLTSVAYGATSFPRKEANQ